MTMLNQLSLDFSSFMLTDWGVDLTVAHVTGQTLNPATGVYTDTETTETLQGIVATISKKDVAIAPNDLYLSDVLIRVNEDDLTFMPQKGDKVTVGTSVYLIIEVQELDDMVKLFCRKH